MKDLKSIIPQTEYETACYEKGVKDGYHYGVLTETKETLVKMAMFESDVRADEREKFVKWLVEKGVFQKAEIVSVDGTEYDDYGHFWLAEYEKEQKNG